MTMKKRALALLLALCLILALGACGPTRTAEETPTPTPEPTPVPVVDPLDGNERVFYQIFVGSFSDSDGDGTGDLRGIINRLDYLNDGDINSGKSLGVQGIWLSPIFTSPSYHKYDVADYYAIDPKFGTEEDLKELLDLCHQRNVKVILDLVINHSSDDNSWFTKFSVARANADTESEYYDLYSCAASGDRKPGITYQPVPGCGGKEWYECNFSGDMPELNYDSEATRARMLEVAKHWLDLGVDGFRFDAVKYIYYGETGRNVEFWDWYTGELRAYKPDIYLVGECWSGEGEVLEYYKALNCFNFAASQAEGMIAMTAKGSDINTFTGYICGYQDKTQAANAGAMPILFLSNHDMDRSAGYLMMANHFTQMGASLYLLSPGSPFIYYGEEIGMKGTRGSANTDSNRRLAMLWGDGDTVKNPVGSTYGAEKQTNGTVASQLEDENSLLSHYKKLISLRVKYPAIGRGDYTALSLGSDKVGGFLVTDGDSALGIVHNVSRDKELTVDLSGCGGSFTQLCEVVGMGEAKLEGTTLTIAAQTSVILK